jgi:hypothetical protein
MKTYYTHCSQCPGACQGHSPVTESDVIDALIPGSGVRVHLREGPLPGCIICAPHPCTGHITDEAVELTRLAAQNEELITQKARAWVRSLLEHK